jgi:hypothetical protein
MKARKEYESFSDFDRLWIKKNLKCWVVQEEHFRWIARLNATVVILFVCREVRDDGSQT